MYTRNRFLFAAMFFVRSFHKISEFRIDPAMGADWSGVSDPRFLIGQWETVDH